MPISPCSPRAHPCSRPALRGTAVAVFALVTVLGIAVPASAHVTVASDDATKAADDATLTFRVPNERDDAVTMKLDIKFPTKNPIASVKPEPKTGWTVTMKTVKFNPPIKTDDGTITSGVGEVVYTATSKAFGIPVNQADSFHLLVGPLPDTDTVAFPTVQTYSNGTVASWVEPVTDPANPPENPAPVLTLVAAAASDASPSAAAPAPGSSPSAAATPVPNLAGYATTSQSNTARNLGIAGIVLGALGLLVGAFGITRARRRTA
jgi:periplasmic copper chaperone A